MLLDFGFFDFLVLTLVVGIFILGINLLVKILEKYYH